MAKQYPDSKEQAAEFVRLALPIMTKHGIPPSPPHYRVWYDYVSGRNPKLKESVDRALHVRDAINQDFSEKLYEQYVEQDGERIAQQMREEVHDLLNTTLKNLLESGDQTSHYDKVLRDYASRLSVNPGREGLRRAVTELLAETKSMQESNQRLETSLKATNDELESLRKELDRDRPDATRDALTGIANRADFDQQLPVFMASSQESGRDLALILADVDQFTAFNEQHGRLLGDKVLRFIAQHLSDNTKGTDFVARFGGQVFAIILPCTALSGGLSLAEAIRASLEVQRLRRTDTEASVGKVTLSLGVSCYRAGDTPDSFLQRAQDALQRAKREGRNRACCEIHRGS